MKTRFLITLIRWRQASDQPLPAWLDRACRHDPRLQAEREHGQALSQALRGLARPVELPVSPSLEQRIRRSLTATPRPSSRSLADFWNATGLATAACAALALVVALVLFQRYGTPDTSLQAVTPTSPDSRPAPSARPDLIASTVIDTTSAVVSGQVPWANPLRQEMSNVMADARGAMRFLAGNFLPSSMMNRLPDHPASATRPTG